MTGNLAYRESRMVAVNRFGHRVGEDHPRAKLTNEDVDLIRELLDPSDGSPPMPQRLVAQKFEVSRGTIGDIASCRRRAVYAEGYRRVPKSPFDVRVDARTGE